jgi:DNA-directed RNA polymerase specialized sigma24 family protein
MQHLVPQTCAIVQPLPEWVPDTVRTYLAHVEGGASLRNIARQTGVHASTVMRQVRRCEGLRDDPLADAALKSLEMLWHDRSHSSGPARHGGRERPMTRTTQDTERLDRETLRALRALTEPDALLVIADGIEDAVVVSHVEDDRPVRRAVVPRDVAEILALKEWIAGQAKGRLARYRITPAGRSELGRLVAATESRKVAAVGEASGQFHPGKGSARKPRTAGAEPPLRVLARRKRTDGAPFLTPAMVRAAERFRESYEIARAGGALEADLEPLLSGTITLRPPTARGSAAVAVSRDLVALESLVKAVKKIGPELAEAVILACCRETGMEQIEEQLEFPARSGKIILRIALGALQRHYDEVGDENHDLIY